MCGGRGLIFAGAALIAIACGVIAIFLQASVIYDVRGLDLRNASTGEGFDVNEGTCVGYISDKRIDAAYGETCTADSYQQTDLQMLVAANVHQLYDLYSADTAGASDALKKTVNSAKAAALGTAAASQESLDYADAIAALKLVGADESNDRVWKTKCSEIYTAATAPASLGSTPVSTVKISCDESGTQTNTVTGDATGSTSEEGELLLHCNEQFALGAYAGRASAFYVAGEGTFGLPLHGSDDDSLVTPFVTPPPFREINGTGASDAAERQLRAKQLYGHRFGWTLFGAMPTLMLAVFIAVDGVLAFLCYITREGATKDAISAEGQANRTTRRQPWSKIAVAGATLTTARRYVLAASLVGFIISIALTAAYDWSPWNWGTRLPRPICDATTGEGWQSDSGTTTSQLIIYILLAVGMLVIQIASAASGLLGTFSNDTAQLKSQSVSSTGGGIVRSGTGQALLFFALQVLVVVAFMVFETTQSVTWGNAWHDAILEGNATSAATFSDLVIESTTRNVAIAVTGGIAISSVFARWMFTLNGTIANLGCAFVWLFVAGAAALPVMVAFGTRLAINPVDEDLATPERCALQTVDSFERTLCDTTDVALTYYLLVTGAIIILTWLPWCCTSTLGAFGARKGASVDPALSEVAAPYLDEYQRLPLLSLRTPKYSP